MKKKMFSAVMLIIVLVLSMGIFTSCNKNDDNGNNVTLTFAVPEGTPALAIAKLYTDYKIINDKNIEYSVVSPSNIAKEIGKSDMVIMPVNAGAMKIYQGADYKLVSVAVDGSIYVIGKSNVETTINIQDLKGKKVACIGQSGVPGLVFRYVLNSNSITIVDDDNNITNDNVYVQYVADGNAAITLLLSENVDYVVVGEPAATAIQKGKTLSNGDKFLARMSLQDEYAKIAGVSTFPQAGLFVKSSVYNDTEFMTSLFSALEESKNWVINNPNDVNATMKSIYESATFPSASISKCALDATKLSDTKKQEVLEFLKRIQPKDANKNSINWDDVNLF